MDRFTASRDRAMDNGKRWAHGATHITTEDDTSTPGWARFAAGREREEGRTILAILIYP